MIVIMRDAVMPDCCKNCVCSAGYGCEITSTIMTTKEMESRPDWCPLEEVEPCEDAVSREAVSKWLKQYGQDVLHGKYKFSLMYIWKNLMDLASVTPKEQPEIIYCKECKYGEQDEVGRWYCRGFGCQVGNDDGSGFCADAERREEGEQE